MRTLLHFLLLHLLLSIALPMKAQHTVSTDVLIIGGGASGTMAGIQCARMGTSALIVESTGWLGGMLTAAGVSAIDGDHRLPSGLWAEFRQHIYDYYGGPDSVETGWVSNTLFEPHVANAVLQKMAAAEKKLQIWFHSQWVKVEKKQDQWQLTINRQGKTMQVSAKILIDATELGDIMAATGTAYRLGMDSRFQSGEMAAPFKANDVIQDMTYVAVLKDFGPGANKTIPKPAGYDPSEFHCSCDVSDPASFDSPQSNCYQMMQYGRLPHNKYMINWPKCGNDIYLNIVEMNPAEREKALEEAKLHTLRFVYYLQTELGYRHLGLADDEFPTADKLPMIPYHRESRRLKGVVTLSLNEVAAPYRAALPLYRTGIAVGDYPIDHHHLKNPSAPAIDFVKIKVPSYNVPMGSLIPEKTDGLIVAEKSISVTNIVNGTTRLQPVVMQIGQAAGAMAALCIQKNIQPRQLAVRELQQTLLKAKVYLMPFIDVPPSDPQFESIQKIGATGILQGKGIPYKWANQTWFYPNQPLTQYDLLQGLKTYYPSLENYNAASGEWLTPNSFCALLKAAGLNVALPDIEKEVRKIQHIEKSADQLLLRRTIAAMLEKYIHPFERPLTITGFFE